MTSYEHQDLIVTLWRMVYQAYTRFRNGMDRTLAGQGLTMEQYSVIAAIKYHEPPVRITDIARWLERSTNSVSMLVDRMVKAGLVRRVRDRNDRRTVNVFLTSKAVNASEPASPAVWEFMQQGMSPLSSADRNALATLLKAMNRNLLAHLNPGADVEGMLKEDDRQQEFLVKQWHKQPWLAAPKARRSATKPSRKR